MSINNESKSIDSCIDLILCRFDELFANGKFSEANQILLSTNPYGLLVDLYDEYDFVRCPDLIVAFLSSTLCAKDKLPARVLFFNRSKEILEDICPDRVEELLKGLE